MNLDIKTLILLSFIIEQFLRSIIALANAERRDRKMAITSIVLDKFKPVNETLSYDVGDISFISWRRRR